MVEEYHFGAVAVVDGGGRLVASWGDIDRPFFVRSAAKPFQATAALESGVELPATHLALACASHSGDPVHIAIVADILSRHGLSEADLRCPPARPWPVPDRRLAARGAVDPARRYHNCSGKHATMLAACRVAGWDTEGYLDPTHPLQERIEGLLQEVTGGNVGPPGIDGCGAPVWRVDTRSLAVAYARLDQQPRWAAARSAMARYPMLVSGEDRGDGTIARWLGAPAKAGAAGCMAASVAGYGIACKTWTGSGIVAGLGITLAIEHLGMMTAALGSGLAEVIEPPILGGGEPVGRFRAVAALETG